MSAPQRIAAIIACLVLGLLVWGFANYRNPANNLSNIAPAELQPDVESIDTSVASKDSTPEDVVRLQLKSLHDSLTDPDQLKVCYSLASPENRRLTGPFSRFASMVMQPPYDQLALCTTWEVSSAEIEHDLATVLVSTPDNQEQAFQFILRRHGLEPYAGCWLTDAVQILQPAGKL